MGKSQELYVSIKESVKVDINENIVTIIGPKGKLSQKISNGIIVAIKNNLLVFDSIINNSRFNAKQYIGLYKALVTNMIEGVINGFSKSLELVGVGYRAFVEGNTLKLQVGYSLPVFFDIPDDLEVKIDKSGSINIFGINKKAVGDFAAKVRAVRKPEPYKGKGIRYQGEYVRRKAGKTGK